MYVPLPYSPTVGLAVDGPGAVERAVTEGYDPGPLPSVHRLVGFLQVSLQPGVLLQGRVVFF